MSAPQSPQDRDPQRAPGAPEASGDSATYDFHGEKLDFDPYRFGAPEPVATGWNPAAPSAPGADPARPVVPGERWNPTGGPDASPDVRPGDYWQGGGAPPRGGAVFPPPGYTPPPPDSPHGTPPAGVDLDKSAPDTAPGAGYPGPGSTPRYPPPAGFPSPGGPAVHPPAGGYPPPGSPSGYPPGSPSGYPPAGGYPTSGPSHASRSQAGNRLAVAGFIVAMVGCALFFTSLFAILIGGTGLGLSIPGYVKARRGAPHKTFAVLGIVFSLVAIAAGIAVLVYALSQYDLSCIANLDGDSSRLSECVR